MVLDELRFIGWFWRTRPV